jgi:hypothetical protein
MAISNTFSGARAIFFINGAEIGYAGGVSGEETIDYEPVDVLNLLEVREHVPVAYRCSLNAQIFRVVGKSLKAQGILPKQDEIIRSGEMDASIQDSVTLNTVQLFQGVRSSGHSFDISARGIVSENCPFVAIRVKDEFESPV